MYDFDTRLEFPSEFEDYYNKAFKFPKDYPLTYRVVNSKSLIENFASDRSHMIKFI